MWVRSIHAIYNPLMAIKVLNEVLKFSSNAELCMVGPIKDNTIELINELIFKWNLQEKVTLTGKLEKKEWIKLSEEYDIFINTSNFDNLPVSLMEAMALGLPIITTNVGGIPFLINHNSTGILVNQNDSDEIVVAVTDLITQKINGFNLITNARNEILNYEKKNIIKI